MELFNLPDCILNKIYEYIPKIILFNTNFESFYKYYCYCKEKKIDISFIKSLIRYDLIRLLKIVLDNSDFNFNFKMLIKDKKYKSLLIYLEDYALKNRSYNSWRMIKLKRI